MNFANLQHVMDAEFQSRKAINLYPSPEDSLRYRQIEQNLHFYYNAITDCVLY